MLPGPAHALAGAWFELSRRSERTGPQEGVQSRPEKSGGAAAVAAGGPLGRATVRGQLRCLTGPKDCWCRSPSSAWVGPARARGRGQRLGQG